jgi:hypothetical protein
VLAQKAGFRAVFAVQLLACAPALPLIALSLRREPAAEGAAAAAQPPAAPPHAHGGEDASATASSTAAQLRSYIRAHWRPMAAAYAATLLMSIVRSIRDLVLPLASEQAGLTRAGTGFVTATSYAGDTLLFPLGGLLMDRRGVGTAGAASCGVMALGLLLLTTRAHASAGALYAAAAVTGVGNGLSSGIVMALGADMAPAHLAGAVLSTFNFVAALGGVAGPLFCGALAQAAGLRAAAAAAAAAAAVGSAWWALALPHKPRGDDGRSGGSGGGGGSSGEGTPLTAMGTPQEESENEGGYDGHEEALLAMDDADAEAAVEVGRGESTHAHAPHAAN